MHMASGKAVCIANKSKSTDSSKELGAIGVAVMRGDAGAERRPEIMYALIPHLNSTARTKQ